MFDFDELEQQEDLAPAPTEAAAYGGQILGKVEGKGGDHQLDEDCKA